MAQGKKSFVLYADLIHTVKKLPKEKQADLFLMILEYVNDLDPTTDDLLLDIAFDPIKRQLKRDLNKWETSIEQKSINGRMGNLKKYNPDIYQKILDEKITLEDGENLAKSRKGSLSDNSDRKASQAVANLAVNDNVNVNDTVNVNVINNNKSFVADANRNEKEYRKYLFETIKEKQTSRDILFMKSKIDLSFRNQLWEDFIKNSIMNTPLIENDKHAWNTFKKFVTENEKKYQPKLDRNPT